MTMLYTANPLPKPGTHVLVIGVGRYPHLIGGGGRLAANPLGLKQLSSPPLSAARVLQWLLEPILGVSDVGFRNAECPLASIEALISSTTPAVVATPTGPQTPDPATMNNIQTAFDQWLDRVKGHPSNTGVVYFCGHGIMVADHYLLAEDFGANNNRPWHCAFDISNTIRAIEREIDGTAFILIDACRVVSREVALTLGANPQALKAVELRRPVTCQSLSQIEATGEGEPAFAAQNQVSRFTEALTRALSGQCGIKMPGSSTWDIDGETLASAVRKLLETGNKTASRRQVSDQRIAGLSVPLTKSAVVPTVAVELDLSPEPLRRFADFTLTSAKGVAILGDGANGIFRTTVPRGIYSVSAAPKNNQFGAVNYTDEELVPPLYDLMMRT